VTLPAPATTSELQQFALYKSLRSSIHAGPLYSRTPARDPRSLPKVFGEEAANDALNTRSKIDEDADPFTGVPTYGSRYEKKDRAIPLLSGRPFIAEFFPEELQATLEGEEGEGVRRSLVKAAKRKRLILASTETAGMSAEERQRVLLEKLAAAEAEEDGGEGMEDGEEEEEEQDYDYEMDEDEMGGDYDAEQYFDDGDGGEDDGDGGGGDGGDY
jgi:DNA-directed RNA polymerase III subunit RPC7